MNAYSYTVISLLSVIIGSSSVRRSLLCSPSRFRYKTRNHPTPVP